MDDLRDACAAVAERASAVRIDRDAIGAYAASLAGRILLPGAGGGSPAGEGIGATGEPCAGDGTPGTGAEARAAFWLTLDAINFGSGWFPTLRKRDGLSGYETIAAGLRERFHAHGPWSAAELAAIDAAQIAAVTGQDPAHELIALFTRSLSDVGRHVAGDHGGSFAAVAQAAGGSAVRLARTLGGWESFADTSRYGELAIPFLKRAQIAAADLDRCGAARFADIDRLTMFADNLVPHVLRLDGVLRFDPELVARIDREQLIAHDSPEEVEIRACAVHAVELIVTAAGRPGLTAAAVDQHLWQRGRQPFYKASPRHRARCTAY